MKKFTFLSAVLLTIFMISCGSEVSSYNEALDGDRGGREKMITALASMAEANKFALEESEDSKAIAEEKQASAVADFQEALKGWETARTVYQQLIIDYPDNPEYLNNLGNMIYYKAYSGLEADLNEARELIEKAISKTDKPRYNRNLELIDELASDPATLEKVSLNRELVKQIRAVK